MDWLGSLLPWLSAAMQIWILAVMWRRSLFARFPLFAACHRSGALVPADHGPANAPKIPRAATIARNVSFSNHSVARSATAIGP